MPIQLPSPQVVEISGPDTLAFAQSQFSSDVLALPNGHWQWSAWLSAQGRARAFFHLLRDGDERIRLILRGGLAAALRDALTRYVLRAKVKIQAHDAVHGYIVEHHDHGLAVHTLPVGQLIHQAEQITCIALPGSTPRWLYLDHGAGIVHADNSDAARNRAALADIDAGVVTLDTSLQDRLLPDWIGLADLGATSVRKGCYPGQEIVARLHFKGGNKRWLHRLSFQSERLPPAGTPFADEERGENSTQGLIVCAAWRGQNEGAALAVLHGEAQETAQPPAASMSIITAQRVWPRPTISK